MESHVVIGGYGRSGSNMVLDLFDLHARTHCRNEPNVPGGALDAVADFFVPDAREPFLGKWRAALAITARSAGVHDHLPTRGKVFLRPGPVAGLAGWLQSKARVRRVLGLGAEWPCPSVIYDPDELAKALLVVKVGHCGGVAAAHADPGQKLVHVLRSPADVLNSWFNRYVGRSARSREEIFADMAPFLSRILPLYDADPGRFATYSLGAMLEGELWLWRYINDVIHALSGSPRYLLVGYADAKARPAATTETLYRFAGIDFDDSHAGRAERMRNTLFAAPHGSRLPQHEVARALDAVLRDTSLPV